MTYRQSILVAGFIGMASKFDSTTGRQNLQVVGGAFVSLKMRLHSQSRISFFRTATPLF